MIKDAVTLARELLRQGDETLEELLIHEIRDDEEAHDDAAQDRLERDFVAAFDEALRRLRSAFGEPLRLGDEDDDVIPLCGVFRWAVWEPGGKTLFLAAAHEDREVPYLLMLGTRT
jgi:hypothetical protein